MHYLVYWKFSCLGDPQNRTSDLALVLNLLRPVDLFGHEPDMVNYQMTLESLQIHVFTNKLKSSEKAGWTPERYRSI